MRKKILVVGLSLAVGATLLLSTALASATSLSGYEAYKNAAENTFKNKNATVNLAATITDNGEKLAVVNSVIKADQSGTESFSGMTTVLVDGKTINVENYGKDGEMVTKVAGNDTYYVNKETDRMSHGRDTGMRSNTAEEEKVGRMFMDAMVGDLKNNFVTNENADGSSTITLNLTGSQLPAYVNGLVGLAVKDGSVHENHNDMKENSEICKDILGTDEINVNLPKLTQDVSIKGVTLVANVSSEKIITSQTIEFSITGKDEAGKTHEISFTGNMGLSDLNKTTPDNVDLTGKTVKVIEQKDMESNR